MPQGVLSVLVNNHFGVLTRVTSLFGRRGFNIRELTVGETEDPAYSRITIVAEGGGQQLEQMKRQLDKLEDVKRAVILPPDRLASYELLLVKTRTPPDSALEGTGCKMIEAVREDGCAVSVLSGTTGELNRFLAAAEPSGILEFCRTGSAALETGPNILRKFNESGRN